MAITLKPGDRVRSAVCTTELIVVRAPKADVALTIGGIAVAGQTSTDAAGRLVPGHDGGCEMGKRYIDTHDTLEMLCTKRGDGVPAVDGRPLQLKQSKPLPSSD